MGRNEPETPFSIYSLLSKQNKGAIVPDEYDGVIQPQKK